MLATPGGSVDGPVRAQSSAVERLWQLEPVGKRRYEGWCHPGAPGRVFGGQVVAQALAAALTDVDEDWWPESLHAYFVREGRSTGPIEYEVDGEDDPDDPIRFRRVIATQGYEPVLILETSFVAAESGLPRLPALPDEPDDGEDLGGWTPADPDDAARLQERVTRNRMQMRFLTEPSFLTARKGETSPGQAFWLRTGEPLPDEVRHHACAFAYASDLMLVSTALAAHGLGHREGISAASIDHGVWFHQPFRADAWIRIEQASPTSAGGRGLSTARVFDRSGQLVASIWQEVLLRIEG
jgi:acyl-CoA thioesterase-2